MYLRVQTAIKRGILEQIFFKIASKLCSSAAMPAFSGSGDSTTSWLGNTVQGATVLSSVPTPALAAQPQASMGPVTGPPRSSATLFRVPPSSARCPRQLWRHSHKHLWVR
ncbi:hypothetical protein AAC387_Pa12g0928 [Persea americana]